MSIYTENLTFNEALAAMKSLWLVGRRNGWMSEKFWENNTIKQRKVGFTIINDTFHMYEYNHNKKKWTNMKASPLPSDMLDSDWYLIDPASLYNEK